MGMLHPHRSATFSLYITLHDPEILRPGP